MTWWGGASWDIARAGGLTAYVLLTCSVALGLALSLRLQAPRWPRLINYEMHNFVTLLTLVFTVLHVAAVWIDPFTRFGWYEVFVPFASHYRPLWMALGIMSWYMLIAVAVSTWLQRCIGYAWWRRLHFLSFAVYVLSTVHGIATGSDTRSLGAVALYGASVLIIGSLLIARLAAHEKLRSVGRLATVGALAVSLVALAAWTVVGPLQPGWNQIANNGQGSGSRDSTPTVQQVRSASTPRASAFAQAFQADASGTLKQLGPDSNGVVTIQIDVTLTGRSSGPMRIRVFEQRRQSDSEGAGDLAGDAGGDGPSWQVIGTRVQLGTTANAPVYTGALDTYTGSNWQASVSDASASPGRIQLHIQLTTTDGSTVP